MKIDFGRIGFKRMAWVAVAVVAVLVAAVLFVGQTVPKMASTGDDAAGASLADFVGPLGSVALTVFALIRAAMAGDPVELASAISALLKNPTNQALITRAESAFLAQMASHHPNHPSVLQKVSELGIELAKINFPAVPPVNVIPPPQPLATR